MSTKSICQSLRLLGYKFRELGNRYLIAERHNGVQTLFDNEGNQIMSQLKSIEQISDVLYTGINVHTDNEIIFDRDSNIISDISKDSSIKCYRVANFIRITDTEHKQMIVYENNLHFKFTFNGDIVNELDMVTMLKVIYDANVYKILFVDSEYNLKTIDSNMNVYTVCFKFKYTFKQISNSYITRYINDNLEGDMEIINYNGEAIYRGRQVYIDTVADGSDTVAVYTGSSIIVSSINRKFTQEIPIDRTVYNIKFTTHKNVIVVVHIDCEYALNVVTLNKTREYKRLVGQLGTIVQDDKKTIYEIDFDTFNDKIRFKNVLYTKVSKSEVLIRYKDLAEYYTTDLQKLMHEF